MCISVISSMEGMEGMETPLFKRLSASIPQSRGMERYGRMNKFHDFEIPKKPSIEDQTARMREANPECAALVDEMREVFGSDVVVTAICERGKFTARKSHKPESEFSVVLDGEQFLRLGKLGKQAANFSQGNGGNGKRK